jgi:hypothetical protein
MHFTRVYNIRVAIMLHSEYRVALGFKPLWISMTSPETKMKLLL